MSRIIRVIIYIVALLFTQVSCGIPAPLNTKNNYIERTKTPILPTSTSFAATLNPQITGVTETPNANLPKEELLNNLDILLNDKDLLQSRIFFDNVYYLNENDVIYAVYLADLISKEIKLVNKVTILNVYDWPIFRVSPQGDKIAIWKPNELNSIQILDLGGRELAYINNIANDDFCWSSDNETIFYTNPDKYIISKYSIGGLHEDIVEKPSIMAIDCSRINEDFAFIGYDIATNEEYVFLGIKGGAEIVQIDDSANPIFIKFSPDGTQLGYWTVNDGSKGQLFTRSANGVSKLIYSDNNRREGLFYWSPDSSKLLIKFGLGLYSPPDTIVIQNDGSIITSINSFLLEQNDQYVKDGYRWAPTGDFIAFQIKEAAAGRILNATSSDWDQEDFQDIDRLIPCSFYLMPIHGGKSIQIWSNDLCMDSWIWQ